MTECKQFIDNYRKNNKNKSVGWKDNIVMISFQQSCNPRGDSRCKSQKKMSSQKKKTEMAYKLYFLFFRQR